MKAGEIHDRIQELEWQLGNLEDKSEYLAEATSRQDKIARISLIAIGQPECREFCEVMYDKLPRELRDMVYIYIIDTSVDKTISIAPYPRKCTAFGDHRAFYPIPHSCLHGICASHFLDKAYVGTLVQREITEAWFASRTFWFDTDWRNLLSLLNSDRWLTRQPAYHFISHIVITVSHWGRQGEYPELLEALTLLKPLARVTFLFDFANFGKRVMVERFQSTMCRLWPYIEVLDQSRLILDVGIEGTYGKAIMRLTGGTSIHGWSKLLEEVSLQCVCGL